MLSVWRCRQITYLLNDECRIPHQTEHTQTSQIRFRTAKRTHALCSHLARDTKTRHDTEYGPNSPRSPVGTHFGGLGVQRIERLEIRQDAFDFDRPPDARQLERLVAEIRMAGARQQPQVLRHFARHMATADDVHRRRRQVAASLLRAVQRFDAAIAGIVGVGGGGGADAAIAAGGAVFQQAVQRGGRLGSTRRRSGNGRNAEALLRIECGTPIDDRMRFDVDGGADVGGSNRSSIVATIATVVGGGSVGQ